MFAEMKRRQDAIAKARPLPAATGRFAKPAPKSEIEALLHAQPQTTAQHVGHHKIPKMPPPKPEPPRNLCAPDHSPRHPSLRADRARLPLSGRSIRSSRRGFPTAPAEKWATTRTSSPAGAAACLRSSPAKRTSHSAQHTGHSAQRSLPHLLAAPEPWPHQRHCRCCPCPTSRVLSPCLTLTLTLTRTRTRMKTVNEGRAVLNSLRPQDVVADPELNDALFALRSRIAQIEMRSTR